MKFKIFFLCFLLVLTNCSAPGTALLGPILTGLKTGSAYQTSISYGSNKLIGQINREFKKNKKSFTKVQFHHK